MIKITGLWEKQTSKGTVWTGKLGLAEIVIFKNDRKDPGDDRQPDYNVYVNEPRRREETSKSSGQATVGAKKPWEADASEIPF